MSTANPPASTTTSTHRKRPAVGDKDSNRTNKTTATTTATTEDGLYHWKTLTELLCHDVDDKGHRLFLPFFTTYDLLNLSECSNKALVCFRHHLKRISLLQPGEPDDKQREEYELRLQEWNEAVERRKKGRPRVTS